MTHTDQKPATGPSEIVVTELGQVQGERFNEISIFRGIPYAASTAGHHRFKAPQPREPWRGVRNCADYGETAPQMPGRLAEGGWEGRRPEMGEDCLCLNVWTPSTEDTSKRPVMVWLHGGGFEAGTGSSVLYDGTNLARRGDVVIVTVNHRLNIFGHCHLEDLLGEEYAGSANAGYLDIVQALKWVQSNISNFGGNPDNVTIFGQSGGGRKVSLLTADPNAKGLFHKGIVQSGSHLRLMAKDLANDLAEQLLKQLGIQKGAANKIAELSWRDIRRANRDVVMATRARFSPTLDGTVFNAHPWDPEAPASALDIPMMIGTCRTELSNQLGSMDESTFQMDDAEMRKRLKRFLPEENINEVVHLFARESPNAPPPELFFKITTARGYWRDSLLQTEAKTRQQGAPVYAYRLMWRTPVEGGRRITPHSLDLPFMFDNVTKAPQMVGAPCDATSIMAEQMSESWLAFAKSGNPNNPFVPEWRDYDFEERTVMLFDETSTAASDPHKAERLAMEKYESQQKRGGVLHF
jgi:para-nitrobenzyl esterase